VHWLLSGCLPVARANLSQTLGNVTLAIELAHEALEQTQSTPPVIGAGYVALGHVYYEWNQPASPR